MITFTSGNLFNANVQAFVNTVNTVGVSGKGIAKAFKELFPENYEEYKKACERGEVVVGRILPTLYMAVTDSIWIVNFPTKQHWVNPSKIEWIEEGLKDLKNFIIENKIESIAIPPLGCGNGKLDWNKVKPLIEDILGDLVNVEILVFEPSKNEI